MALSSTQAPNAQDYAGGTQTWHSHLRSHMLTSP